MCQHLYPYSERGQRKRDYPLHYSEHNPWQPDMAAFDRFFSNLGAILAQGEEYAPLLVIHPIHGAYCKYKKGTDSLSEIEGRFFALSRFLWQNQVPYHWGDEWMMERLASVEGKTIRVGRCTYGTVMVPFTYSLDGNTVKLLKEFKDNGGRILLFDGIPAYVDGLPADGALDFLADAGSRDEALGLRDAAFESPMPEIRKMTRILPGGERIVYLANVGVGTHCPVKIDLPRGSWAELDADTLSLRPVCFEQRPEEDKTVVTLKFADAESHVLVCSDEIDLPAAPAPALTETFIPIPRTVRLAEKPENLYTLDAAARSDDGVHYDEPLSIYGIKDNLLRERYDGRVWLKFTFDADHVPAFLRLAVEPMYERITVNGIEVTPNKAKWWFDKSFATADIAPLTHEGTNEIVIEVNHHQRDYVYYVLYSGVSESLRNCLVFDVEIEPIYLLGDFALRCNGVFADGERNATVYDGSFTLTKQPAVVPARDVVRGGYPFYGGPMTTAFEYDWKPGRPTVLKCDGRFAVAHVAVNGEPAGTMLFERELDLAAFLKEGANEITVKIVNSMRNAMGPHHRHDPEPYGVGPGTFSFEKEWHGRECRGYAARYAFVRFGLKK